MSFIGIIFLYCFRVLRYICCFIHDDDNFFFFQFQSQQGGRHARVHRLSKLQRHQLVGQPADLQTSRQPTSGADQRQRRLRRTARSCRSHRRRPSVQDWKTQLQFRYICFLILTGTIAPKFIRENAEFPFSCYSNRVNLLLGESVFVKSKHNIFFNFRLF